MAVTLFTQKPPVEVTGTIARSTSETTSNNNIFAAASTSSAPSSSSGSCICVA